MDIRHLSLALTGVLGLGIATCGLQAAENWDVVLVQNSRVDNRVVLGGTVVPSRQVTISAQAPGRVEFIAGAEGDSFKKDTALVRLDQDQLLAQRSAAVAQMQNADAAMRNAGVQYTRELVAPYSTNRMPGMGLPSMFDTFFTRGFGDMMGVNNSGLERRADLFSRGTVIEQARSSFLQARSKLQEVDARLRDTIGKAPFDGVITDKVVEVGDSVQPGQPLLKYADTRVLEIQVEVPSRLMPGLREGITVPARLDVHDALVQAKVSRIFPMADPRRHTVTVKFKLTNDAPAAPGMYAEVLIADNSGPGNSLPSVPVSALVRRGSLPAVFVLTQTGRTELRLVRLGEPVGGNSVSVLSGVRAGERVINNPPPGMVSSSARGQ